MQRAIKVKGEVGGGEMHYSLKSLARMINEGRVTSECKGSGLRREKKQKQEVKASVDETVCKREAANGSVNG